MKQRIEALLDEDLISVDEFNELMNRERYVRGALQTLAPKLGESFSDFKARSYGQAKCRARGHRWDEVELLLDYRPIGARFYETERCDRCGMVKIIIINGIGVMDRTHYKQPPGYRLEGTRTSRSDWKVIDRYNKLDRTIEALAAGITSDDSVVVPFNRGNTA